jgi:hypothetical protein
MPFHGAVSHLSPVPTRGSVNLVGTTYPNGYAFGVLSRLRRWVAVRFLMASTVEDKLDTREDLSQRYNRHAGSSPIPALLLRHLLHRTDYQPDSFLQQRRARSSECSISNPARRHQSCGRSVRNLNLPDTTFRLLGAVPRDGISLRVTFALQVNAHH